MAKQFALDHLVALVGSDNVTKKSAQWSFSGAMLYSIIVITTIGYGDVAPRTNEGKIVTILYAIIGIPLMLFCLSNIGHAMAHSFKFIYWKCLCYLCVAPKRSQQKTRSFRRRRLKVSEQFEMRPTAGHNPQMQMYYSRNEQSHWRPSRGSSEMDSTPIICNKYALNDEILQSRESRFPGPPPTPSPTSNPPSFQSIMNSTPNFSQPLPKHTNSVRFFADNSVQPSVGDQPIANTLSSQRTAVDNSSDESDDTDEEIETSKKSIPITVCLALVISYICGGAWFFHLSEGWSFLDASYFCFVTLSTIGFGDLVPGNTVLHTAEGAQVTLAICALYLLFGMALLAMLANLVKEKVTTAVRSIGQRIGILVSDDDDDY